MIYYEAMIVLGDAMISNTSSSTSGGHISLIGEMARGEDAGDEALLLLMARAIASETEGTNASIL